jgi:predicted transposase YdaD
MEQNGTEVMNMLITEWNMEDALAVRYEEGKEEGWEAGHEKIARNALAEGASVEFVQRITGLDIEAIECLKVRLQ